MTEEPRSRPRRALPIDEGEDSARGLDDGDDTPRSPSSPGRRGEAGNGEAGHRVFRRPGSEPPVPVLPIDDPGYAPRRSALSATEPGEALPAPRRSASSASWPLDDEPATPATATPGVGTPGPIPQEQPPAAVPSQPDAGRPAARIFAGLGRSRSGSLAIGALALALITFMIVFATTRGPAKVVQVTSSPDASPSQTSADAALMSAADANLIAKNLGWKVATTSDAVTSDSPQAACLVRAENLPNPVSTKQRTLSTASGDAAALHQIDRYASAPEAVTAYAALRSGLAVCDAVPAHLESAATVTTLADEVTSVTVAYQDPVPTYHTLLLARTGQQITTVDVAQNKTPMAVGGVVASAAAVLARSCSDAGGACPASPKVTPAVPPAGPVPGWLVDADLPRLTPGMGLWTSTPPANLSDEGTACENVSLPSVKGPTARSSRTYLITQDSSTTENFGVDSLLFSFSSANGAAQFAKTLNTNLVRCASRMATATVGKPTVLAGTGEQGTTVSASTVSIQQKQSASAVLYFRTAVVTAGTKVVYLVGLVGKSYDFTDAQWSAIGLRAGQRATQIR